jgi:hypothetical protein
MGHRWGSTEGVYRQEQCLSSKGLCSPDLWVWLENRKTGNILFSIIIYNRYRKFGIVSVRKSSGQCQGSSPAQVTWDLWWTKRHWDRFSPNTSVSPVTPSTDCSTLIIFHHPGLYNKTNSGRCVKSTESNQIARRIIRTSQYTRMAHDIMKCYRSIRVCSYVLVPSYCTYHLLWDCDWGTNQTDRLTFRA